MLSKPVWSLMALSVALTGSAWAGTFGRVVAIGGQASDLALDESRGVLYVANFTANRIDVVSLATQRVQTSINVAQQPSSISLSPDAHYLLITHFGNFLAPAAPSNALTLIDLTTGGKQTFALSNPPLGTAFGADGKALVVTTSDYQLFDPVTGYSQQIDTIANVTAKTLPVPAANFPPQITSASVATSGDGQTIYGLGGSTGTFTFRYDVVNKKVQPGGVVLNSGTLGPRVVSVNQDASSVMAGWIMVNNLGTFTNSFAKVTNQFNVGSTAFDDSRGLLYAQIPEVQGEAPVLKIVDSDNLTVRERLQLAENLAGKSVLSSDSNTLYAVSDSGVTILPVGSLSQLPRVAASQEDLVFRGSFCDRKAQAQDISIVNPGGGNTSFSISSSTPGITVSPSTGVTPAVVHVTVDPNAFQSQQGTASATLQLSSSQAVNIPQNVRVLINSRQPDQRGTVVDVPGKLADLLSDPARDRFYVLRQDQNQVLVYDGSNYTKLATLRTGNVPNGMAISYDQRYLLVGNDESQIVNVYDLETLQVTAPIRLPSGNVARSVAVSSRGVLATTRYYDGTGRIVRLDLDSRTGSVPATLGVFQNLINPDSVMVASQNGSSILIAQADGTTMLYDANSDTFAAARKDFTALSGAYAASNYNQYVVGNSLLNASLVAVKQFDSASGLSSGFSFVDQTGFRSTVPGTAGTPSTTGTTTSTVIAPTSSGGSGAAGVIQRLDLTTSDGALSRATRLVEAPLMGSTGSAFTRTLAPLYSRNNIINLTTSGFTVLPWDYDSAVAPPVLQQVVNAADYGKSLAPGGLISVFGQQLSPVNLATKELPVPTALGDSCLTVNGQPVPILFVSPSQVNAQLPFEASGNVTLILRTPGGVSDNYNLVIQPGAPGVFRTTTTGFDSVPAVVRSSNNQIVTQSNPVHRGDTLVIYLTGLGQTSPAVAAGAPSPSKPLARTVNVPVVNIGGVQLSVLFAGLSPGEVGVYQINATVPKTVPTGLTIPLVITQGAQSATVSVRVVE